MIEITELDELLNTLATSALEPHEEYKMEFSNREQKLIYEYIKQLQQENQQLKEELNTCMIERNKLVDVIEEAANKIENLRMEKWSITGTDIMDVLDILDIKGD